MLLLFAGTYIYLSTSPWDRSPILDCSQSSGHQLMQGLPGQRSWKPPGRNVFRFTSYCTEKFISSRTHSSGYPGLHGSRYRKGFLIMFYINNIQRVRNILIWKRTARSGRRFSFFTRTVRRTGGARPTSRHRSRCKGIEYTHSSFLSRVSARRTLYP